MSLVPAVVRWVVLVGARSPLGIVVTLGAFAAIPLQGALSPWTAHGPRDADPRLETWGTLLAWLGLAHGLRVLSRGQAFLARFARGPRFRAQALALAAPAVALQGVLLTGALAAGAQAPAPAVVLGLLGVVLHGTVVALLLLATPWTTGARLGVLVGVLWLLPALLGAELGLVAMSDPRWIPFAAGTASAWLAGAGEASLLAAAWRLHRYPQAPSP